MKAIPSSYPNVTRLDLPEATFTILYGMHIVQQNPEELPTDVDYLLLETGMHEYLKNPEHTLERLKDHVQYRALFKRAEKNNIPVVFTDLKYKYNDFALLFLDNALSAGGWFLGQKLLKKNLGKNSKQGVRSTSLQLLLAGWLMLPFAVNTLRLGSTMLRVGEVETNKLKRLSHKLHPEAELLYLTLRNAVIAEKAVSLAKEHGKRPHIAIVLGAGHVGIEDMLLMKGNKRLELLRRYQKILRMLARPDYLYKTLVGEKQKDLWNVSIKVNTPLQEII